MKLKDIAIILFISLILTYIHLWYISRGVVLDTDPGFCPYPDFSITFMLPICMHAWWYIAKVYFFIVTLVVVIWVIIKSILRS
jgi:hypothetical protein